LPDFAKLPLKPEQTLKAWQIRDLDNTLHQLGLAKLILADQGWIKFMTGEGRLVMYATVNVLGAEQCQEASVADVLERPRLGRGGVLERPESPPFVVSNEYDVAQDICRLKLSTGRVLHVRPTRERPQAYYKVGTSIPEWMLLGPETSNV
jgi:hypothetical protein